MKILDSRFPMSITDMAFNAIAQNPFKYPKPSKLAAKIVQVVGDRKREKPNVSLTTSLEYVYQECIRTLLKKYKENMLTSFDKLVDENKSVDTFQCGSMMLKRTVYLYPWEFRCMMVPVNPKLTMHDIDNILGDADRRGLDKFFYFEIESAELKYKVADQRLQVRGNALNTARTRP